MKHDEFENAEAILAAKDMSELTHDEQQLLLRHFGNMEEASNYRDFIVSMQAELLTDDVPEPDIFTAERVRSRMRELKREAEEKTSFVQKMLAMLNYRVKVYQPAIAMLAIIAVFMAIINNHDTKQGHTAADTLYADSSAVQHGLDSAVLKR